MKSTNDYFNKSFKKKEKWGLCLKYDLEQITTISFCVFYPS